MGGNPNAVKGGTGKAEAAKLPDAGISPKPWPKKKSGRKRLAYSTRRKSVRRADHVNMREEKKRSRMYARGCCPLEELHRSEGGKVSYRWDWAIRGEESTGERSARFEERDRSPMEVADDGLEHRLRRLLPVADQPGVGPSLAGLTPL